MSKRVKYCLLISSVLLPGVLLFAALAFLAVDVPYWDDYDAIVRYMGWPFHERMRHLFDFHNEHRIVTVRLFLEAMAATTGKIDFKACMFFGSAQIAVLFACFAFLHLRQFGRRLGLAVMVPAAWHLFSMLNFDNAFWALTSLENFGVLMWAFLAIVLVGKGGGWLVQTVAILCAILSALTSAQGLAVFPVLFLSSLVPDGEAGSWRGMLNLVRRASHARPVAMLFLCVLAVLAYFHGFSSGEAGNAAMESSFVEKILYVIAFLGNLVPVYPLALVCGVFVVAGIAYACFCFPRLPSRMRPVFFFMLYCTGVALAGVFFRAAEARAAISFRYYIISACLFISLTGCLLSVGGGLSRIVGKSIPLLAIGFCLLDLAVTCVGWPMFKSRNEALRVNILTWPGRTDGLRIEEDRQKTASEWLRRMEAKGLYETSVLLREGESRPKNPVPWPKPNFP